MTYLQILERLAIRRGARVPMDDGTKRRYGYAVNEAHRQLLRMPGMELLRQATVTFASVADQQMYALPSQGVARINRITEATNDRRLMYQTPDWLDTVAPDPTVGTPWAWVARGYRDVHTQPDAECTLYVDSTTGSDTMKAFVEGITAGGYYQRKSVQMGGTSAVEVSAQVSDWIQVTKFYLASAANGTVTLHQDSEIGTELSQIAPGDVRAQFMGFQLYPTPSSVITYTADVLRSLPDMVNNTDEPLLPEDFHDLLVDKAELKELRKQDDPNRFGMLLGDIKRGESELRSFVVSHPDWRPQFGAVSYERSSLGAYFPADNAYGAY